MKPVALEFVFKTCHLDDKSVDQICRSAWGNRPRFHKTTTPLGWFLWLQRFGVTADCFFGCLCRTSWYKQLQQTICQYYISMREFIILIPRQEHKDMFQHEFSQLLVTSKVCLKSINKTHTKTPQLPKPSCHATFGTFQGIICWDHRFGPQNSRQTLDFSVGALVKWISWESKGTPPMPPPPGNKALLRDY